jgi:hypothetical protein
MKTAAGAAATTVTAFIQPLATALIAWAIASNGFPQAPEFFRQLCSMELFQYFLVFVLIYQGGGRQDAGLALMVTLGLYLVTKILSLRTVLGSYDIQQQQQMMMMAQAQAQARM